MTIKFMTTFAILRNANACASGYETLAKHLGGVKNYGKNTPIPLTEIVHINGIADAFWVLDHGCPEIEDSVKQRLAVTFACDVAERVLGLFECIYPDDDRPSKAIATTRDWLACREGPEQEHAAALAARAADAADVAADVAVCAAYAAADAADVAADAAYAAAYAADVAVCAAYAAADAAYAARAADAAADAAYAARAAYAADEQDWQKIHLIELLGPIAD